MIKALHHTAISVSHLDRSIRFYCDLLKMTLEWRIDHRGGEALGRVVGMKDVDVSYAMLNGWGSRIELFQYHSPEGQPFPRDKPVCDKGITHLAFLVDDIDALYEELLSRGVRFNSPPLVVRPGVKVAYFHDPDEVTIEMMQLS